MVIEYTGRQFAVTHKYRQQVEAGLNAIERVATGATSAKVVLTADKYRKIAEIAMAQRGLNLVARCEAAEMATALHDALAKLEQQAVRQKQKITTSKRHPRTAEKLTLADGMAASA